MPPEPMVNQVADAVVKALKLIGAKRDATKWFSNPAAVRRGFLVADLTQEERPLVLVRVQDWDDQPTSAARHQTTLRLSVTCILDNVETADQELNRMTRDVIRAITDDEALKGLVVSIYPVHYELEEDAMARSGLAIATVVLEALYMWNHGAP